MAEQNQKIRRAAGECTCEKAIPSSILYRWPRLHECKNLQGCGECTCVWQFPQHFIQMAAAVRMRNIADLGFRSWSG